jgi:hypothetical protein
MRLFRSPPVKYRCIACKQLVREGQRHDYVRCVSGTSWFTRFTDWLDDHVGKCIVTSACFMSVIAMLKSAAWLSIILLTFVAMIMAAKIDRIQRAGNRHG